MYPKPELKGMSQIVLALEKIIGYKFKNARLAWEALQAQGAVVHAAEVNNAAGSQPYGTHHNLRQLRYGNKRLALIGDTALKLALIENWFGDSDHASPERLSVIVSSTGSNVNLAQIGQRHGFSSLLQRNPKDGKHSPISTEVMSGTVEAVFGAVYLDGGMRSVPEVLHKLGLMPRLVRKIIRKNDVDPFVKKDVK